VPSDGSFVSGRTRLRFVSHSFAPRDAPLSNVGGMQRVAMELAEVLASRPDVELRLDVLRARWDRIALHAPLFLAALPARLIRDCASTDAILFSSMTSAAGALPAFPALRRAGVTLAAIAHGLDVTHPNPAYQLAIRSTLVRLDRVLPVSQATAARCRDRGAQRVEVVPNGVEFERFAAVDRSARTAASPFTILALGRQVPRKGFGWFVGEVMPMLDPRISLVLVGDGPERETIEHLTVERGLEHRVRLTGIIPEAELVRELERADVLIMPNVEVAGDMEGFGIVLLEAAAASLPVVVADLEGMRDVVGHEQTGLLVPSGNARAFAEALTGLADDRSRARALGERGRTEVRARFGWPAIAGRYLGAIDAARASVQRA